jgi:hypothetical protein
MEITAPEKPRVAGSTDTGLLKVLALVFMFCDHAGKMLLPQSQEMRVLGRLAFPLYCWCLVVGVRYTRSVPKYFLRLLAIGLISQPLYMIALDHPWNDPNILFTLMVGLLGLWALREKKWFSHLWGPPCALILAELLNVNYGWRGVLLIFLLWAVRDSRKGIAAVMAAFCLYWGSASANVVSFLGMKLGTLTRYRPWSTLLSPWLHLQTLSILALPLIVFPTHTRLKLNKWVGYAIYPLHLLILWGLEIIFGIKNGAWW